MPPTRRTCGSPWPGEAVVRVNGPGDGRAIPFAEFHRLYFVTDPDHALSSAAVAEFLRPLLRYLRGKVIVVWDRGSNYKGEPIRRLLSKHRRLRLEWLPAYEPGLKPVELLWSYLKCGPMANFAPAEVNDQDDCVVDHLIDTRIEPRLLESVRQGAKLSLPTGHWPPSDQ